MSGDLHLGFIVAAYALGALVVGTMIAVVVLDGRSLRRALARLGDDPSSRP